MRPLLIDTDPGIDDALALLLAWSSPEVRVEAITAVAGNVPVDLAVANVRRLLALRRPDPVPAVGVGAPAPLARPLVTAVGYHGADGLGDAGGWPPLEPAPDRAGEASELIERLARRLGPALVVVALGPLTTLARVAACDAAALRRVGRIVAMGGAVDVAGNVTPASEFNMHVDPDAAAVVLASGARPDLVPLDATRQALLERDALEAALAGRPGPVAERVRAFTRRAFRRDGDRMALHDPLAVGVAVDETLVEWEPVCLRIGPGGETRRVAGTANCRIARRVDTPRFMALFLERLCPP